MCISKIESKLNSYQIFGRNMHAPGPVSTLPHFQRGSDGLRLRSRASVNKKALFLFHSNSALGFSPAVLLALQHQMVEAVWIDAAIDCLLISKTIQGQFSLHVLNGERDHLDIPQDLRKPGNNIILFICSMGLCRLR